MVRSTWIVTGSLAVLVSAGGVAAALAEDRPDRELDAVVVLATPPPADPTPEPADRATAPTAAPPAPTSVPARPVPVESAASPASGSSAPTAHSAD